MRVQLFGLGTKSESWAITAQKRINAKVDTRHEPDRTSMALVGRDGLQAFVSTLGAAPSRGMWAVNSLAAPLLFSCHGGTLYSINNAMVTSVIGTIGTLSGDVSMTDDGTFLMLVDGVKGYYYNMLVPAGLNQIVDANFMAQPKYVTWQDTYFIVVGINSTAKTNQFQLSKNSDPTTWPAVQINFTGSSAGALQACLADHGILNLFGQDYCEFWQDAGSPDFPYALIPGAAQEFGLASPWSLQKFDNSLIGLFKSKQGGVNVSKLRGFSLQKVSDHDIDEILAGYASVADAEGISYTSFGHPLYILNLPSAGATWCYDGFSNAWTEMQDTNGVRFWGNKYATFVNNLCVSDYRNGNIYTFNEEVFTDNGSMVGMEIWSKHIWDDDKWLCIDWIEIDMEQGAGLVTGQGSNPVMDLQVSKDGGNTFRSFGFSKVGKIGEYIQRTTWASLGAARDWVIKLRVTDPIHRVLTGASAEIRVGSR